MRLRERSRRSERNRALIIRSPSACRSSSFSSCLLMRLSRRQRIRDQARSAAATASVATSTAATVLTQRSSTRCGSMPGSTSIAVQQDDLLADQHHRRDRDHRRELDEALEEFRPAASAKHSAEARCAARCARRRAGFGRARCEAGSGRRKRERPRSSEGSPSATGNACWRPRAGRREQARLRRARMRQPAGSSMRPTSAERRASARAGMTKISATRVADSEANSGASREKATSPRSTASWSRFSVGSSVLSSGSTSALIAQLHLR